MNRGLAFGHRSFEQDARNDRTYKPQFVPLTAALTSTSWDGDSFSTTAKTTLDLSSVFSAPAGIRAVLFRVRVNDSGSAAQNTWLILSPNDTATQGIYARCPRSGNDHYGDYCIVCPCDASGDVYYQIQASGAGTLDVVLQIWGYWI